MLDNLRAGRAGGHLGVCLLDHLQLVDALPVGLDGGVCRQVHVHPAAPAQRDVQIGVGDGELAAHQEVSVFQHAVLEVCQLLVESRDVVGSDLLSECGVEQRAEVGVHLAGSVVQGLLNEVSVGGVVRGSELGRQSTAESLHPR